MTNKSEPAKPASKSVPATKEEKRTTTGFGRRTDVQDAHDRYANTDTSYDR